MPIVVPPWQGGPITNDIYGQIISRRDVEQAILAQLRAWMPASLAEVERSHGLPAQTIPLPPNPDNSYRGGIDLNGWQLGWCPCLIAVVQPIGAPEREYGNGTYLQAFEIEVAAIVQMEDEDTAREYADYYGTAVMMSLVQHGSMGTFANGNPVAVKTIMEQYPTVAFPDPAQRRVVRSSVKVHSLIDGVISEASGPATPPDNPYAPPGQWPEAVTVTTTIVAEPLS